MTQRAPLSTFAQHRINNVAGTGTAILGCFGLVVLFILIGSIFDRLMGPVGVILALVVTAGGGYAFFASNISGKRAPIHDENDRDYEASKHIEAALPALVSEVPRSTLNIDTTQSGVSVYQGLQLGEVNRHFDSQTSASIEGWLNHNLQASGSTVSYQRGLTGADYRYYDEMSVGEYSGSITGQSEVHLTSTGTTRDNLLADGFVAVLEQETTEGWMDTLRVIVPSEPAMREYVQQYIASIGKVFPPGTHRDAILTQSAPTLAQSLATDVSYVSDRLNAILRMPPEKRPVIAVVGTEVTAHAIVGGAMQFGNDGNWYQLFPISLIQKMNALVERSASQPALPS